jgi:hypothetical protein
MEEPGCLGFASKKLPVLEEGTQTQESHVRGRHAAGGTTATVKHFYYL